MGINLKDKKVGAGMSFATACRGMKHSMFANPQKRQMIRNRRPTKNKLTTIRKTS
jgi:hypothetical protein